MTTLITGNTYPVRDQLKSLGGRWDSFRKGWRVPNDKAEEARAIVEDAPVNYQKRGKYISDTFKTSGGTFYRNRNGRCEDAPCCGCCTI